MAFQFLWLANHAGQYADQWVALEGGRLIGHGTELTPARAAGAARALLTRLPPDGDFYAGNDRSSAVPGCCGPAHCLWISCPASIQGTRIAWTIELPPAIETEGRSKNLSCFGASPMPRNRLVRQGEFLYSATDSRQLSASSRCGVEDHALDLVDMASTYRGHRPSKSMRRYFVDSCLASLEIFAFNFKGRYMATIPKKSSKKKNSKKKAPKEPGNKPVASVAASSPSLMAASVLQGMLFVLVQGPSGDPQTMSIRGPAASAGAACQMQARTVFHQSFVTTNLPPCSGDPICRFL